MALDDNVCDLLKAEQVIGLRVGAQLIGVIDRNLVQGFGVILENLTHQHGGTGDDPATMAALRAARMVPGFNARDPILQPTTPS